MAFKFFVFCLNLSVPKKMKNSIFEIPIIPQTLITITRELVQSFYVKR